MKLTLDPAATLGRRLRCSFKLVLFPNPLLSLKWKMYVQPFPSIPTISYFSV